MVTTTVSLQGDSHVPILFNPKRQQWKILNTNHDSARYLVGQCRMVVHTMLNKHTYIS